MRHAMLLGTTLAAGVAGVASGSLVGRGSPDVELSNTAKHVPRVGLFSAVVLGGFGALTMLDASRMRIGVPLLAAGAFGGGIALSTAALEADRFNSVDTGINVLEHDDFARAHQRRLQSIPLIASGVCAAVGVGLMALEPASRSLRTLGMASMIGAVFGGAAGLLVATYQTASGQSDPYVPSTRDPQRIATILFERAGGGTGQPVPVDTAAAHAPVPTAEDKLLRISSDPGAARFYSAADSTGNGDGALTIGELQAHVDTFDADANGTISQPEWVTLRGAILAG